MSQILSPVLAGLTTVLVLGLLIFIHEMGHFLACLLTGIRVEKFSIGFGRELAAFERKGTRYAISVIPFGGFVKPAGESYEEFDEGGRAPEPTDFVSKGVGARALVIVAGASMNYLLAFVLFTALFVLGKPTLAPVIGALKEDFPAARAGVAVGDRVLAVNEAPVASWSGLTEAILEAPTSEIRLRLARDGEEREVTVSAEIEEGQNVFGETRAVKRIGILPADLYIEERYGLARSLEEAARTQWEFTLLTYGALWRIVTGRLSPKTLSGPLGILVMTSRSAKMGLSYLLYMTAVLSLSLAIFNLLPFPALDGGHLAFLALEAVRRKPVSRAIMERSTQVGFLLLMLLMVFVLYNDLVRLEVFDRISSLIFSKG